MKKLKGLNVLSFAAIWGNKPPECEVKDKLSLKSSNISVNFGSVCEKTLLTEVSEVSEAQPLIVGLNLSVKQCIVQVILKLECVKLLIHNSNILCVPVLCKWLYITPTYMYEYHLFILNCKYKNHTHTTYACSQT